MTRTQRLKVTYVVLVVLLLIAVVVLAYSVYPERPWLGLLLFGLLLLVPGRLQGFFYRDFFRGAKAHRRGHPEDALEQYRWFLEDLRANRWMKVVLWFAWTIYTTDVEAMVLNNVAACHLVKGDWQQARDACEQALKLDELYPLPHVTLATLAIVDPTGSEEEAHTQAEQHVQRAAELGYHGTAVDVLIQRAQALLAEVEGR